MNAQNFIDIINNPTLLNKESLIEIEKLVDAYPYIENIRIIYALNLLILDDYRYQEHLTKAAFYASDRRKLKSLVDHIYKKTAIKEDFSVLTGLSKTEKKETKKSELITETSDTKTKEDDAAIIAQEKEIIRVRKSKADLLKLVKKRLIEIGNSKIKEVEQRKENKEITDNDLINDFIKKQPSISRPSENKFYDSEYEVIDSAIDDDDFFITETLAQIHCDQKNYQKAKEIYQKLILKFPEKSIYFAARIEDLNKNKKK